MKQFITDNLLNSLGRLNSRKLNKNWFDKNNKQKEYDSIIELTQFIKNELFQTKVSFIHHGVLSEMVCPVCGILHTRNIRGVPTVMCSVACAHKSDRKKEKTEKTTMKKYGVSHHNKLDSNRKRLSEQMKTRWTDDRESLIEQTTLSNTSHISNDVLSILHNKEVLLEKLLAHSGMVQSLSKELGVYYGTVISHLRKFDLYDKYAKQNISTPELEVYQFIKTLYSGDVMKNVRGKIVGNSKLEVDIYIEGLVAVEFNGLYWHTDKFRHKRYHQYKTDNCVVQLLHINENEWNDKQNIWKSILVNKLGKSKKIYARKCKLMKLDKTPMKFLTDNHLQGAISCSVSYGLEYDGELVSVMTFGKPRFNNKEDWELLRFCNKLGCSVVGGASKLFKHFRKTHTGSVLSYANKKWSNGGLYKTLGFTYVSETEPSYSYTDGHTILSRYKCQKGKLKLLLPKFYSDDKSEKEIMADAGYYRIFDSGNYKYIISS